MKQRFTPAVTIARLVAIILTAIIGVQNLRAAASAQREVAVVWQRVQRSGAYRFRADVVRTKTPQASIANAGHTDKRTSLHLEGATDLAASSLPLSLWSARGSVLAPETGLKVRVEGNTALARQENGGWSEIDGFTGLFALGGDFLASTQAAENVVMHGTDIRSTPLGEIALTRYTFDINDRRFAEILRAQMMEEAIVDGLSAQKVRS